MLAAAALIAAAAPGAAVGAEGAGPEGTGVEGAGPAGPTPIEFSADGADWGDVLPAPLFDPAHVWVPGDSRGAAFHVRHRAAEEGVLVVTVRAAEAPARGDAWRSLGLALRVDGGAWRSLTRPSSERTADDRASRVLRDAVAARPGQDVLVELRAAMPTGVRGQMRRAADLEVSVALRGGGLGAGPTALELGRAVLLAPGLLLCAIAAAALAVRREGAP